MSLVITGASGHLATAAALRAADILGGSGELVLTTRKPEAISTSLNGAQVRHADFAAPASLVQAFRGGSRLLLVSADNLESRAQWHRAAIDAAKAAGVQHIIYTSMVQPVAANPAVIAPSHRDTEEYLSASGLDYTILRCALYSDFQVFEAADAIAAGRFVHNRGGGTCSYVSRADCAAVAGTVLAAGDQAGGVFEVTGPQALSATELAGLYSDASGRAVVPVDVDDQQMADAMMPADGQDPDGHAQYGAALAVSLGRAIREGFFGGMSTTVREITGVEPHSVAELLEQHRSMLQDLVTAKVR